jgi:TPR repeat protein
VEVKLPVDLFVCFLPLLIVAAAIPAVVAGKRRKAWRWVAGSLVGLFILIYFVPGWVLWVSAQGGSPDAQHKLGNYYWTRLSYIWSDIEARDKWWVEAAKQGHPHAMYKVGYFSMFGTSQHIPKDLVAARKWLEAAQAAGDYDAASGLYVLAQEEAKAAGK